jgi:hypothetical protein
MERGPGKSWGAWGPPTPLVCVGGFGIEPRPDRERAADAREGA